MVSGSFTPPRQDFARSTAEGTRAAKGGRKHATGSEEQPTTKAAGCAEGPPAPKKSKKKLPGSSSPSQGTAADGGSPSSSSYPVRAMECWTNPPITSPPADAAEGAASFETQVPGPRASRGEESDLEQPDALAQTQEGANDNLIAWQRVPPADFARMLTEQIERVLDAREQRAALNKNPPLPPRAITGPVGNASNAQFRDPLALQEDEEEEEIEGEEEEGLEGARFSDTEEPTIEKTELTPQFFKQEDIQLLINKTISALDLQDQAEAEKPPAPDKTNNPSKPIKGYPKGKLTYFPPDTESHKFFPVPEYFVKRIQREWLNPTGRKGLPPSYKKRNEASSEENVGLESSSQQEPQQEIEQQASQGSEPKMPAEAPTASEPANRLRIYEISPPGPTELVDLRQHCQKERQRHSAHLLAHPCLFEQERSESPQYED
uniref:Uncharacterized protein n=1 Tax=Sphaerodactylus townsendi TaxID=933632 RepID=A0ACB8FHM8_9SAUR